VRGGRVSNNAEGRAGQGKAGHNSHHTHLHLPQPLVHHYLLDTCVSDAYAGVVPQLIEHALLESSALAALQQQAAVKHPHVYHDQRLGQGGQVEYRVSGQPIGDAGDTCHYA
jgi:hypothetical protein